MGNNRCLDGAEQPQCPQVDSPDTGRKLVFDNLDYTQEVHWMTEGHQNIIQKFGFINGVDNVNWPPYRDSKS